MSAENPYERFLEAYAREQATAAPAAPEAPRAGEHRDLWVWIEHVDREVYPASLENLGKARELADQMGARCAAVLFGEGVRGVAVRLGEYGADLCYVADGGPLRNFRRGLYRNVLVDLIRERRPEAMIFPATVMGRNLGAQVAAALGTGIVPNCVRLEVDASERRVRHFQTSYEDRLQTEVIVDTRPQITTITPGSFRRPAPERGRVAQVVDVPIPGEVSKPHVRFIERETPQEKALEQADVVVVGGLGLGSPESFRMVEELAALLGGHVGATRAAVACGWCDPKLLITSSKHSLRPRLNVACGVVGEYDHLKALEASHQVVAITPDDDAPVTESSDLIGLGDPTAILTSMLETLRAARKDRLLLP